MLKGAELSWFGSPDEVFSGATWGVPHGTINLKNNVLIKGKNLRFQILDCDNIDNTNDDRLHNREVAALNDTDLESGLLLWRTILRLGRGRDGALLLQDVISAN